MIGAGPAGGLAVYIVDRPGAAMEQFSLTMTGLVAGNRPVRLILLFGRKSRLRWSESGSRYQGISVQQAVKALSGFCKAQILMMALLFGATSGKVLVCGPARDFLLYIKLYRASGLFCRTIVPGRRWRLQASASGPMIDRGVGLCSGKSTQPRRIIPPATR